LPSEVLAQRMGFEPFDPAYVVDLSHRGSRDPSAKQPYLVLGMRDVPSDDDGIPELGGTLLELARIAAQRGFNPKVVVVDSLSDGYSLGRAVPRPVVDGLCKLAIEQGWGLILIEEVADASVSPWTFAVDTVLSLRVAPAASPAQARRELMVTKHRFGPCEPGPHRLQIDPQRIRVIPPFAAYRNAARDLSLPPPAKNRSLRIPVTGTPPEWDAFNVPDGEGRCVVVQGNHEVEEEEVQDICARIGAFSSDGKLTTGHQVEVLLLERSPFPFYAKERGFSVGTLHQFVDGEDWLEDVLTHLSRWRGSIASVRIGSVKRVKIYENAVNIRRAILLLVDILSRRGLIAIIFSEDSSANDTIRAVIVTNGWEVSRSSSSNDQLTISTFPAPSFVFEPDL
jgi:hypothetical protein